MIFHIELSFQPISLIVFELILTIRECTGSAQMHALPVVALSESSHRPVLCGKPPLRYRPYSPQAHSYRKYAHNLLAIIRIGINSISKAIMRRSSSFEFDESPVPLPMIGDIMEVEPPKACTVLEEEKFSNEMPFACTAGAQSPHTAIASVVASLGYRIFMVFPLCTL
ncbi:hypothetical protein [Delftia sp. Cs1-4]|uniref:hypothetical protein n=1 Tax=Delftia sp. (strain Cs1-4) TaxID=742013 RepID=UPI0012F4E69B|nr:hypothetical protein [Delftia sp. Cs1-4]